MKNFAKRFIRDERGTTAVEYGLIASLLSIAVIASAEAIATAIQQVYGEANGALETATTIIARR